MKASTNGSISLHDLEQRIDELEGLRRELKTRHTKLASLKRRERRLEKQLQRVRDHIDAVSGGSMPASTATGRRRKKGRRVSSAPRSSHNGQPSLQGVIGDILGSSKQPMRAKELAEQALAAGYHSKSKNFANVVQVTLGKMRVKNVRGKGYRLKK